jgi:DNA-directed RNA polymerase subunit RPC12/RpoP
MVEPFPRCPTHRTYLVKDFEKYGTPFWFCPTCGYYILHTGQTGTDRNLIRKPLEPTIAGGKGPLCSRCRMENMVLHSSGWLCPRCGHIER